MGGYLSTGNVQPAEQKKETETQTVLNSTDTTHVSTEAVAKTSTVTTKTGIEPVVESKTESVKTSDIPEASVLMGTESTGSEVFEQHVEKVANKVEIAPVMVSASDDIVKKPTKKKNKNKKTKHEQ
jgi:hypothetical protein